MSLKPFRIPETRLLAINDLVVQVTLTFRTSDDEELQHRYDQNPLMQSLILTTVVSLFTAEVEDGCLLEISEIRNMGMMSPSMASSYAGSVIDGLDAVSLPPVEDVFSPEEYDMGGRGRRSSSVYSGYSMGNNRSPVIRPVGSFSPRQGLIGSGSTGITPEIRRASISDDRTGGGVLRGGNYTTQYYAPRYNNNNYSGQPPVAADDGPSPVLPGSSIRTRSISRSSVGSARTMNSVVDITFQKSPKISQQQQQQQQREGLPPQHPTVINTSGSSTANNASTSVSPGSGHLRLGRTNWYRSLHGISPLSRQPKSLSSSDNEFILNGGLNSAAADVAAVARGVGLTPQVAPPRIAGTLPPPSKIPKPPMSTSAKRTAASESDQEEEGKASFASRLKRRVMTPLDIHNNRVKSVDKQQSAIPRPSSVSRPDMPPPSNTRPMSRASAASANKSRNTDVSIPAAVKNALMRRLRSPLGGHPDKSSSRLSVRERIAAFNTLSVRSTPERDMIEPGSTDVVESDGQQQQQQQQIMLSVVDRPIKTPRTARVAGNQAVDGLEEDVSGITTTPRGKRTRLATATGFISVGSPAKSSFNNTAAAVAVTAAPHVFRSESPASSGLLRAESPAAMSAVSNVSVRVQDTIHALERAANATPMRKPDTVLEMLHQTGSSTSGVKRVGNNDVFDEFASPSKRPRAPSMATQSTPAQPEEEKTLLRNPFSAMRNMVRRHTRR
ncbi:hypothetical protein GGF39_000037 [Coemansia sp. RSA 1721]|nr:hypothetical protein GGF39_000037 [Coemansia sp. RSA 1721]